jgi:hypothetical protein
MSLRPSGEIATTRDGANAISLNRKTSDGDIALFKKDGSAVGSIGTQGGDKLTIGNGDVGVAFNPNADSIYPWNTATNAARDAGVDLGYSDGGSTNIRFRDLYLSGGVYLGGTGAANKLDDYEEGTFTTTISTGGYTLAAQHSVYVKIGGLVHINAYLSFSAVNGSFNSTCVLGGLPFTSSNFNGGLYYTGVGREDSIAGDIFVVQQTRGTTTWVFNSMDGVSNNSNQPIATGRNYSLSITYRA